MRNKLLILTKLLLISIFSAISQDLAEFEYYGYPYANEMYLGVAYSQSSLANRSAPFPENHSISGWSALIDFKTANFEKGQYRLTYKNKLVGDLLNLADRVLEDSRNIRRDIGSSISTGILGWFNVVYNINEHPKNSLAIGFNLNDYFLASTYQSDTSSGGWASYEPQGYFFAAGPSITYNYLPTKYFFIETGISYSIPYFQAASLSYAVKDEDYPHPHFLQLYTEVQTKYGFFIGIDYSSIINRGDIPNKTQRTDLLFGFRFML